MLKLINKNYSQYHVLKESNFVQRYHQTGANQGRNLTSRMPSLKDLDTLKDKEGTPWVIERD